MAEFLGEYKNDYEHVMKIEKETTSLSETYQAFNKKKQTRCCLKIISKEKLKIQDYDFLRERIEKEQEIQILCNSENTINFFRKFETEKSIIFELEYYEQNLYNFLNENGELKYKLTLFKNIVISVAKALKTLYDKGFMHRDIKPHNIYITKLDNDKNSIKLGNFGCAIKINENDSDSIGTVLYNAPEKTKDFEYDEKIDLWSLGVTLFELYFGVLPYGPNADINAMMDVIYNEKNFVLPKTFKKNEKPKIATLDILFKRLLTINPEERMTHNEFFDYVFSDDFMKEGVICVNNNQKYQKIFDEILKEKFIEFKIEEIKESLDPVEIEKNNIKKINNFIKAGNIPDIMNFPNISSKKDDEVEKFNNIIYSVNYDPNKDNANKRYLINIYQDSNFFERETPGAFILCLNLDSFKLIREELLPEIGKDKRMTFNIITSGSHCDNLMKFLDEDPGFKNSIKNVCVYCKDLQKWGHLKNKYDLVYDVVDDTIEAFNFIKNSSSEEIKPYIIKKLINYDDYSEKFKERHIIISQFYGDLSRKTFDENIEKMKSLIEDEKIRKKLYSKNPNELIEGFLKFNIKEDLEQLDKLIIKEYTKETIYSDLNKWLNNSQFKSYEIVAYFTARLMYSLNKYANKKGSFYSFNKKEVRRGVKWTYSTILQYERAKGKIILLSAFTSSSEIPSVAEEFSNRKNTKTLFKNKKRFSIIFYITNYYKNDWISNGIKIQELSEYAAEREVLYQPFSFYYVRDVQIDPTNYKADIYLETIGKKEILEKQIKKGKKIIFNEKERIMQVKQ